MKKTFYGILTLDYPKLSDSELRSIQLGEMETLPGGKTVAEYREDVEAQKAKNLKRESRKRDTDLKELAAEQHKSKTKQEKDETDDEVDATAEVVVVDEKSDDTPTEDKNADAKV